MKKCLLAPLFCFAFAWADAQVSVDKQVNVSTNAPNNGVLKVGTTSNNVGDQYWIGFGSNGSSTDANDRARIGVVIGTAGVGRLVFSTGAAGAQTEKARIDENGNLGVGITNPLGRISAGSAMGNKLLAYDDGTQAAGIGIQAGLMQMFTSNNTSNIVFGYGSSGSFTENIRFTGTGNVGIGTNNPLEKFDIAGNPSIFLEGNSNAWGFKMKVTDFGGGDVPLRFMRRNAGTDAEVARFSQAGNLGIGNTNPQNRLTVQRTGGLSSTGEIFSSDGTQWTMYNSNAGGWNGLVQGGDHSIVYTNGTMETGSMVIGPWSASAKGVRIDAAGDVTVGMLAGSGNRMVLTNSSGKLVTSSSVSTPASCKEIKTANPYSPSGVYAIDPDGAGASPTIPCYCDMTTNGGGWTRINSGLSSVSVSKGSAAWNSSYEEVTGTGQGSGCGVNRVQYTLSQPAVAFTEVYALLTRTSSVLQCSAITGPATASGWYDLPFRGTYTSNSTCNWSDGKWANATEFNMAGLKLNWIFFSNASNSALQYFTECSNTDNGVFTMQWFVR